MFEIEDIKDKFFAELGKLRADKKIVYHTGILIFSQVIVIAFGFITKGIQTRALTAEHYGLYAFFSTITGVSIIFFNFGLYSTVETMLANTQDEKTERQLFGTSLILTLLIGIFFSITLFVISFFVDGIFHLEFGHILRAASPLCIILPFRSLIPALGVGSNKITQTAIFDVLYQVLFSLLLLGVFAYSELTVFNTIMFNLIITIVAVVIVIYYFKPLFSELKSTALSIWRKNKVYGIHYYLGAVFSVTTYKLDELFITYFINTIQLGFYSLANIICSPMVMAGNAFSSALFKRFAESDTIPRKVFVLNFIWVIISSLVLFISSNILVRLFFGEGFGDVAIYIIPLSLSYVFKTLCQPFAFLAAKGKGKEIRNVAILEGVFSIITNIIFIPLWGVMGAIYSSILVRAVDFFGLYYYYRKYVKELKMGDSNQ